MAEVLYRESLPCGCWKRITAFNRCDAHAKADEACFGYGGPTPEERKYHRAKAALARLKAARETEGGKVGAMGVAWYAETVAAWADLEKALEGP